MYETADYTIPRTIRAPQSPSQNGFLLKQVYHKAGPTGNTVPSVIPLIYEFFLLFILFDFCIAPSYNKNTYYIILRAAFGPVDRKDGLL